jgi:hypothetical protein
MKHGEIRNRREKEHSSDENVEEEGNQKSGS